MTALDLAAIRERAEKAVPGPWEVDSGLPGIPPMVVTSDSIVVCDTYDKPDLDDARHIATMDPTTTIALIDELTATRAALAERDATIAEIRELLSLIQTRHDWTKGWYGLRDSLLAILDTPSEVRG